MSKFSMMGDEKYGLLLRHVNLRNFIYILCVIQGRFSSLQFTKYLLSPVRNILCVIQGRFSSIQFNNYLLSPVRNSFVVSEIIPK